LKRINLARVVRFKTAIAVDTIIHQTTLRQKEADYALGALGTTCIGAAGSTCVYVAIGQKI
jgi:F0F1-type ATP synthase alpha subunit